MGRATYNAAGDRLIYAIVYPNRSDVDDDHPFRA